MTRQVPSAECFGIAEFFTVVAGSGIRNDAARGRYGGHYSVASALAAGPGLYALISVLGPVFGAHCNPPVSMVEIFRGCLQRGLLPVWGRSMWDHF